MAARTTRPLDDFLNDAQLHRLVRAILRSKRIPAGELQDATQDVLTELVAWCQRRGIEHLDEIRAGARVIATNIARKWWRDELRDQRHNVGLTGDADEYGPQQRASSVAKLDVEKIVAEIRAMVDGGTLSQRAAEVLLAIADETTLAEHAAETQQSAVAVRQAHGRAMGKFLAHLGRKGLADVGLPKLLKAATATVSIALLLFVVLSTALRLAGFGDPIALPWKHAPRVPPKGDVESPPPPPHEEVPESVLTQGIADRVLAAREVLDAEVAYKRMEWRVCAQHLKEAKKLDSVGGDFAELRNECNSRAAASMDSKGGPVPRRR